MTARILIVDDIPANVRLLEARLSAEYFDVVTASNGMDALAICQNGKVDLVLLDIMMPGIDGFEVCARLKADPATHHIPVVMVTALDQPADRIRGLEVGADDFLTKPANDLQLMTRVKSLVRLKALTDELRLRSSTTRTVQIEHLTSGFQTNGESMPRVLVVDEDAESRQRLVDAFAGHAEVDVSADPQAALFQAAEHPVECILIATGFKGLDPLRLCAQLRSLDRTRLIPTILIASHQEQALVTRALELGVNDYLMRPIDRQELIARMRTQVRRKRCDDRLRASVANSIAMAVTDPLTGLHNRRYLDTHLQAVLERSRSRNQPLSLLIADLDRFKSINDRFGHDGGDEVLREFARRLRNNIRGIDLACRFGGEEFVVIMPDTERSVAQAVAERLRSDVASLPFSVEGGLMLVSVTTSVGVAEAQPDDTVATLFKRADQALYGAKTSGRNRVVAAAA